MRSLLHEIERRVLDLGGENIVVRGTGSGSGKLIISFVRDGEPCSALMTMPAKRNRDWMRLNAKAAVEKAIK